MGKISEIYNTYSSKPTSFIFPIVAAMFYGVVGLFVMLFLYLNLFIFLRGTGLEDLTYLLVGVLGIFYVFYLCGFKGGMLKGIFSAAEKRGRFTTASFITYSLNNAAKFFVVYLFQFIINALFIGVFGLLMMKFLGDFLILLLLSLGLVFMLLIVNYLLFYTSLALVVYDGIGAIKAITGGIRIAIFELSHLLLPYIGYVISLVLLLIPIVNLIDLFMIYPIMLANAMLSLKGVSSRMARYL